MKKKMETTFLNTFRSFLLLITVGFGIVAIIASGGGRSDEIDNSVNIEGSNIAPSILGTSFGNNGVVIYDGAAGGNSDDSGTSITLDSDGKIIMTGISDNGTDYDMVICRYNRDGTLDTTFGNNGVVVHNNTSGFTGEAITIDSDGKILATAGSYNGTDYDMAIWRYNSDGTLDTTFGNNGVVVYDSSYGGKIGIDFSASITLDSSGKILVTGLSGIESEDFHGLMIDPEMVIRRYNSDGTPDTTFGNNGMIAHNNTIGGASTIDSDGKILATAIGSSNTDDDMTIRRYNSDGTPDNTFGNNGVVVYDCAADGICYGRGISINLDSNGKILVTGESDNANGSNENMVIRRYNSDGTLDTTFGNNGVVVHNNTKGGAITIDGDGKILAAAGSYNGTDGDIVIWRYNSDGTLDTTFGNNGVIVYNDVAGGNGTEWANSIILDDNGDILVTGGSYNGTDDDMVIIKVTPMAEKFHDINHPKMLLTSPQFGDFIFSLKEGQLFKKKGF